MATVWACSKAGSSSRLECTKAYNKILKLCLHVPVKCILEIQGTVDSFSGFKIIPKFSTMDTSLSWTHQTVHALPLSLSSLCFEYLLWRTFNHPALRTSAPFLIPRQNRGASAWLAYWARYLLALGGRPETASSDSKKSSKYKCMAKLIDGHSQPLLISSATKRWLAIVIPGLLSLTLEARPETVSLTASAAPMLLSDDAAHHSAKRPSFFCHEL